MQREAIARAAAARGEPVELWLEESRSGGTMARPELARLLELARGGGVRRLYVFRLDRLTRTGIRDTLALLHELAGYGCRVESIADGFSLEGPGGEIVAAVLGWAAQMERLALGERIAAARVRVEAAGKKWGRPSRLSLTDPATRELAEKVLDMKVKHGKSIRYISQAVKMPRATIGHFLSRVERAAQALSLRDASDELERLERVGEKPSSSAGKKPGLAKVLDPPAR
ncbi:MAG TPA: recombinase family protein [Gammaproteobacteria bacterium]|nr:recombinase family protein [Gammaproteobacteria bacterium]